MSSGAPCYSIGTILLSPDFRIVGMNAYARDLLGPAASDLGKSVFHFHPKKSHSKIDHLLRETMPTKGPGASGKAGGTPSGRGDHDTPIAMIIDVLKRVLMINVCRIDTYDENMKPLFAMNFIDVTEPTGACLNPESGVMEINKISIYHEHSYLFLEPEQIFFIQSDGNYSKVCTETRCYYLHMPLKNILARYVGGAFFRIHKSFAVNLEHVREIKKDEAGHSVASIDSARFPALPIARRKLAELKKALDIA